MRQIMSNGHGKLPLLTRSKYQSPSDVHQEKARSGFRSNYTVGSAAMPNASVRLSKGWQEEKRFKSVHQRGSSKSKISLQKCAINRERALSIVKIEHFRLEMLDAKNETLAENLESGLCVPD